MCEWMQQWTMSFSYQAASTGQSQRASLSMQSERVTHLHLETITKTLWIPHRLTKGIISVVLIGPLATGTKYSKTTEKYSQWSWKQESQTDDNGNNTGSGDKSNVRKNAKHSKQTKHNNNNKKRKVRGPEVKKKRKKVIKSKREKMFEKC